MWDHLKNINLLGTDNNPNTPTSAYDILCHYKNLEPHQQSHTRDESTEAYYQRFEVAISTSELAKTNGKTYMKLNKTYAGGNDENGTKRFQAMHLLMSTNSEL